MNRAEILKSLLADYKAAGGDITDLPAATAYLNARKPPGMGRVTAVICGAVNKQMGAPAQPQLMTPEAPPVVAETAPPVVIATQTVTFPEVMREKPQAIYWEGTPLPIPEPLPVPVEKKEADPIALPSPAETVVPPKKNWLGKLKFWGKK